MDRSTNLHDHLFSPRGSPPPGSQSQRQLFANNQPPSSSSSPNHLDSLFQNLNQPLSQQQYGPAANPYGNSAPATPNISTANDDAASTGSAPAISSTTDRQSALLSLLYTTSSSPGSIRGPPTGPPAQMAQQVPTPPASSQRSGQSPSNNSESQGKFLLEQLMSGTSRSTFSDSPPVTLPQLAPASTQYAPQPTASQMQQETYANYHEGGGYLQLEESQGLQDPPIQAQPPAQQQSQPQPQQQSSPSPSRKSMFDFVSPFDALASSSSTVKKKPVPAAPPSASSGNEDSWTSASLGSLTSTNAADPKRKSVENLIEQLTRAQPPPPLQPPSPSYDPYSTTDEFSQVEVQPTQQQQRPPPLPPKPMRAASPRSSPPKMSGQQRPPQVRSVESPVGPQPLPQSVRRDKESSPGPRGPGWKGEGKGKGISKAKSQSSPSSQAQSIVFDVSQALDDIQAPRDAVKSTAIALVKQDAVFLPGTTIGATHWIAYAMTKGRVRVISRSSGDRTLLQLPPPFPPSTSVIDMAVYGNRLGGVTSDGGFVVWELPEVITDDVPGRLLLCVVPSGDVDSLQSVKWHPKQPDTLAVASESQMFVLDLTDAARIYRGEPLSHADLHRIAQVFSVPSRLIAFDFDVPHYAIATISEDSTLTLWNVHDKLPFWSHKVRGDDVPSSLTFIDDGIVIGRKNGTIFQLLSVITKNVLSTFKFVNGNREDPEMFGHVNYDSRIQTLWVANNRRDSLIALKVGFDVSSSPSGELIRGGYFEQTVEFSGPKPTIHFVILSADADPTGDEAHAACIAAKVPPGELALVAFSVHSSGVDQVLIRKEWFDTALMTAPSKFPPYSQSQAAVADKAPRQHQIPVSSGINLSSSQQVAQTIVPARLRTPPSEEVEGDTARDEVRVPETKGKAAKGKNVAFRDRDENGKEKERERSTKSGDSASGDSVLTQSLAKEIRKSEESLHTRIGRLIGKEMDKQHQRLEEARAHEQAEDFTRQEKILKLISTELTRNTTRVVEMAVKAEVQNSVLPALENITRTEVRSALNEHVGRGLAEFIQQSLPNEIEKLLVRPDISNHFASILSSNLNPLIERYVKDVITKSFVPAYSQQTSSMHQEIIREMRTEIMSVKKDSIAYQTETARSHESLIRDLEHSVRMLSDQVKFLTMNTTAAMGPAHHRLPPSSGSPIPTGPSLGQMNQMRSQNLPPTSQAPPPSYGGQPSYQQQQQQQPPSMHGSWFPSGIAAPQASHPVAPPPPPPPLPKRTPPASTEEWDDTYLAVLGTQDPRQLRELLSRSNPEIVMPMNSPGPLSQAVVLTLLHRLAAAVGETPPVDEGFKSALWWLQRTAAVLNTSDPLIAPYVARVVPNVQGMLNSTKQRLAILPGGSQLVDSARAISDIQDALNRKSM